MRVELQPITPETLVTAAAMFGGFVAALFLGSLLLPGPLHPGAVLPDGTRKNYRLNGLLLFLCLGAVTAAAAALHLFSPLVIYRYFFPLLVVANVFAFGLTLLLYVKGRSRDAGGPRPGGVLAELFYGVELNPEWLGVDLKLFSYRPSLMGLGLVNVSFAFVQYAEYGRVSTQMWLYQAFYLLYLANYFQFEYGMLFTWDVIAERFGWMLVWGDYVLVPFFYSIAGWYVVHQVAPMPAWAAVALVAQFLFGFCLFRGANEQKHQYRRDPNARIWGRPAESLGGRLLVSGFWGIGRKLNYTGEILMYYAWSLTAGFGSAVPYLVPIWLTLFLPIRAWRDDRRCRDKYGELWEAYCQRARFRMVPFIY